MSLDRILISIITPCFSAEKYLLGTYASIKSQSHQNWEWIVVDDRSTDRSWEILYGLQQSDPRIRIFQNEINSGTAASRNRGIDEARGEFIAFLDADDEWTEEKLERQLGFMISSDEKFSCHDYFMMSEGGVVFQDVRAPFDIVTDKELRAFNPIATSFVMIKKSCIGHMRFDPNLRRRQDWVFWHEILKSSTKAVFLHEMLGKYRKDSANSISKNKFHMARLQWTIYRGYFKQNVLESVMSLVRYALYAFKKHYGN